MLDILEKELFGLKIKQYINQFLKFFLAYIIGIALLEIIQYLVMKSVKPELRDLSDLMKLLMTGQTEPENKRLLQLLKFLNTAKPVWLLIVSFLLSRWLYSTFAEFKSKVYGQGLICSLGAGLGIGIALSIFNFLISLFSGEILNAVIDLISFLWTSWEYVLITVVFIDGIIFVRWIIDNYSSLKDKISEKEK